MRERISVSDLNLRRYTGNVPFPNRGPGLCPYCGVRGTLSCDPASIIAREAVDDAEAEAMIETLNHDVDRVRREVKIQRLIAQAETDRERFRLGMGKTLSTKRWLHNCRLIQLRAMFNQPLGPIDSDV